MRKNVASQVIGVQMITAADGTDFTGAVTVYVTGDAGTQAAGSVGSGACTHEGNGYHTYAPAQAETNYNLVAFTFKGTGAITVTVQVFTISFDPHDTVRLGLTALPNAAADAAGGLPISDAGALDLDAKLANTNEVTAARMGALTDWINGGRLDLIIDAILADTNELQGDWVNAGRLDALIDAIKAKTDSLTFTVAGDVDCNVQTWKGSAAADMTGDAFARIGAPAGASVSADIANVPTVAEFEARTIAAENYFDPAADTVAHVTLVDTTTTNTDMRGTDSAALASVCTEARLSELDAGTAGKMANQVDIIQTDTTTDIPALIAALNDISVADITGAEVDNDGTAISLAGAFKLFLAVLTGKSSGGGSSPIVFRDIADAKNRISATVDANGNRTAVGTRDAT